MPKIDIEKLFIWGSILFLFVIGSIFSYRFVHFYRLSNKPDNMVQNIYDAILIKENNDNFYKIADAYFFRGKKNNNYVIYSGILWRIIKLENNTLTLISDIPLTNLYFDSNYEDSIINSYLNNTFYDLLDQRLIIDTEVCTLNATDIHDCSNNYSSKVVLPSFDMYDKVGGMDSFINNGYYMYLSNGNSYQYYINDSGKIGTTASNSLYGIKPVITINSADIVNGEGTFQNPYLLDKPIHNLKEAFVGNYIYLGNQTYRIVSNDENYVQLILDSKTEETFYIKGKYDKNSDIFDYLNNDFYRVLDNNKIISSHWFNGYFDNHLSSIDDTNIECYFGFANIGDLFINDISNYALMSTPSIDDMVYVIKENGIIYKEESSTKYSIRPMVRIKNNFKVTGLGTKSSPYVLGDKLDETSN